MIFKQFRKYYAEDYRYTAKVFFLVLVVLVVCSCGLPHKDLINDVSDLARSGELFNPNEVEHFLGQRLIKKNEQEPTLATSYEVAQNSQFAKTDLRLVVAVSSGIKPTDRRAVLSFDHLERYKCLLFIDVNSKFDKQFTPIISVDDDAKAWRAQENLKVYTLIFVKRPKISSECLESFYLLSKLVFKGN